MCHFKNNLFRARSNRPAFTMVEVIAALVLLGVILSSVTVLMNRYAESVMNMELRQRAFELARGNMEQLLTEAKLSDITEFGVDEFNPDIEWQTLVEPFYEPITNRMWVRAVCSAEYKDSEADHQNIEMEHWITNLTAAQVKQILAQQQVESEYLDLLAGGADSAIQETTTAYLREQGLDAEAYDRFAEQQKRKKLEYITEKGFDGYEKFVETLKDEENEFLEELGMDFDTYNQFAASYIPKSTNVSDLGDNMNPTENSDSPQNNETDPDSYKPDDHLDPKSPEPDNSGFDWSNVPPELIPLIEQLLGIKKPS